MIKIRKAKLKDLNLLVNMWWEFFDNHRDIVLVNNPWMKPYLKTHKRANNVMKKFFTKNIRSKNGLVLIAEVGDEIAGYCMSLIKKTIPVHKIEKIGYISDLFVKEKFRGKKISSAFHSETVKWLRKNKIKHVSLMVNQNNPRARKVYNKWGFKDYHIDMRKKL